jgi:CBS-domain-containing membrane protein
MAILTLLAENAGDLMTGSPVSIEAVKTADEAAKLLTTRGIGAAVVIDVAGHPVGVVTKSDLLIHSRSCPEQGGKDRTLVRDLMTTAVFSVRTDTTAQSVIQQMLALNVHHLFVLDNSGTMVGVISPVDILRKLG